VRTQINIKLPFQYKNTGYKNKGLYLDNTRLKHYLLISDECASRLTTTFNNEKFKIKISLSKFRLNKYNLAIRYKNMIEEGRFKNQTELARENF